MRPIKCTPIHLSAKVAVGACQKAGKSYLRGRVSTVDLLVLASLDQLLVILKYYLRLLQNGLSEEEVNGTELSPSVNIPCKKS
jgi:hypothetical protein